MWINRSIDGVLRTQAVARPALILTGARQVGKTSLLRKVFPQHSFVSLDLPSDAALAEEDPGEFLRRNPPPVLIDEVQYAPKLFRHLKRVIDQKPSAKGQFILTGSQKFTLMKEVSDSLAGRVDVLELEGLSVNEIHGTLGREVSLTEILLRGGFPELYQDRALEVGRFYRSYVQTYLERDLRQVLDVAHLRDFERFLRACAFRSGQLLNKSDLARDVGISPATAGSWLSALQASNQVALLEPWFRNRTKSVVKAPKLYLCDTGILLFLLGIRNEDELVRASQIGSLWETLVYGEIRKALEVEGGARQVFFWKDRSKEVDFVVLEGARFRLIECKWKELPDASDTQQLRAAELGLDSDKILSKKVVCRTERAFPIGKDVQAVPIHEVLAD